MENVVGALVPIVAIVMGIGMGAWSIYLEHQRKRMQYEERRLMIEKGITPPPMPPDVSTRRSPERSLRSGFVLLSLGIGLLIAFAWLNGGTMVTPVTGNMRFLAVAASVTTLLGIGHLVYYAIARNRETPSLPPVT